MLTQLFIGAMPLVPGPIMRRIAGRYIAGETQHARAAAAAYARGAEALASRGLDAYISVKPTHMGLTADEEELPLELYSMLAERCAELGVFLRVEMEDHPTTDATLRIFEKLRARFDNVGIVLQARLLRTLDDIAKLAPGPLDVRMVKGIYLEPASIAHTEPRAISRAFVECCRALLERGSVRLRLATHDEKMGIELVELVREFGLSKDEYEFQVLLGVQEQLWTMWQSAGHPVRVYVPFGPEWRSYSQRRLRKNPDLFRAVMRDLMPF